MRLKGEEIRAIKDAVKTHFGESARVFLFGSRTDDSKRGGDIDLLVEHDSSFGGSDLIKRKLRTMSAIQLSIGDRKIDIVTVPFGFGAGTESQRGVGGEEIPLIIRNARKEGMEL